MDGVIGALPPDCSRPSPCSPCSPTAIGATPRCCSWRGIGRGGPASDVAVGVVRDRPAVELGLARPAHVLDPDRAPRAPRQPDRRRAVARATGTAPVAARPRGRRQRRRVDGPRRARGVDGRTELRRAAQGGNRRAVRRRDHHDGSIAAMGRPVRMGRGRRARARGHRGRHAGRQHRHHRPVISIASRGAAGTQALAAAALVAFVVAGLRMESTRSRRATDRATQVMEGRAEIASIVAHDVRGPPARSAASPGRCERATNASAIRSASSSSA